MSYVLVGENEYWVKDNLDATGAQWRIAYSQRGPGKSYQIKLEAITRWIERGEQFGLVRRNENNLSIDKVSEYWDDMTDVFLEKAAPVYPSYESFVIVARSGKWTVYGVSESGRRDSLGVIGYYFAVSTAQRYKSGGSYPAVSFLVYEEFMSESHAYLPAEFDLFLSIVSTVKRRKKNFVIYMLGNTVDMNCPLLEAMGIDVRKIAPGDVKMFTYYGGSSGDVKNTVAVEYIRAVRQSADSESFFIFNRQQENMIINGEWLTGDYPVFEKVEFWALGAPDLCAVLDRRNIKLYFYFFFSKKEKIPVLYVSPERLGNRFRYIFITAATDVRRQQFGFNSQLEVVKRLKDLTRFCILNRSVKFLNNLAGADFDDLMRWWNV